VLLESRHQKRIKWAGYVAYRKEKENAYICIFFRHPEGKRPTDSWKYNIKTDLKAAG
jgi:hypothetical protein